MKICYLNHDLKQNTGAGRFCLSLLGALKEIEPENKYKVLTHDDELPTGITGWFLATPRLRKIFNDFDIIHALDAWPYGFMVVIAARGLGKKVIITAAGTGAVQPLYSLIRGRLLRWAYRNADVVTAISNNTKREILKKVPDLNIQVINHGVDAGKFQDTRYKTQTNNKLQITNYKPYILSVGTLKKRKGYDYSIRAFAQVAKKFPDLNYVIVGEGLEREALKLQVASYKLQGRVIFLKSLNEEELVSLYQNAELFILLPQDDNKDIEGFGLVFLEAAASGLPVIATKDSSAEDAVLDGENGILVSQQDFLQASEAIIKILSNRELKDKFSKKSREFSKSMNWTKVANQYLAIY